MISMYRQVLSLLLISLAVSCHDGEASLPASQTLHVYAATSLTKVMPEIADSFRRLNPDIRVENNFAASSVLAKQIEHGAPADLYLSAHDQWIDYLDVRGDIHKDSKLDLVGNQLVVVVPTRKDIVIQGLEDLRQPRVARIALGDWRHVPVGIYAKQALQNSGIWKQVESKCIPALDAHAALTYVERGDVDCGIVYRTDAYASSKVRIAYSLESDIHPRINYSVVKVGRSLTTSSRLFLTFLESDVANQIFDKHGFITYDQ